MKLFPEASDVFFDNIKKHREYFLPLATLELSELNKEWEGQIHFIQPIEPYGGNLRENTKEFHSYHCRENWLGFKVQKGKYLLETDFNFFEKSYIEKKYDFKTTFNGVDSYLSSLESSLENHYKNTNKKYEKEKNNYLSKEKEYLSYLEDFSLGGEPIEGNWSMGFPLDVVGDGKTVEGYETNYTYPLTRDGRRFYYIGYLEPMYFGAGDCGLLLFYDPVEEIALNTYYWT